MAYDENLAGRIRESLEHENRLTEKKMFGGLAFMKQDKMFCGIIKDELMVRVPESFADEALEQPFARPMDFTGKPMRGFVYVSQDGLKSKKQLDAWIKHGLAFVAQSPQKKKSVKKPKG